MYLKTITLRGFKSFKTKNTLVFEPGVSVVVGPNGSGKSNIADAISWVLGEQSPKSLRGASMGDVIFRNKEEEMGIAEVSLIFDNKDKAIDLDFSEVKFTRRVYSEGGSDYFVNSSPCRLMDIQELLADSGIGKGLYTIINQGQINEMAILKPQERKQIIDEVVGISKHKIRREKSEQKLKDVEEDMGRINDLMGEIKRTMDPLEIEAAKAREYSEVANQLKNLELSLFITQINQLNQAWNNKNKLGHGLEQKLKESKLKLAQQTKRYNQYQEEIGSELNEYRYWENTVNQIEVQSGRLSNIKELCSSKVNVFSTLASMFEFRMEPVKEKEEDTWYQKLERVQILFEDFFEKVEKSLDSSPQAQKLSNLGKNIKLKIIEILKLYGQEKKKIERLEEKRKIGQALRKACLTYSQESKRLLLAVKGLQQGAKSLKGKAYPEYDKIKREVQQERSAIESLNQELNQIKNENSQMENQIYKNNLDIEQIKEKTENLTRYIVDNYNLSIDYIVKNYQPADEMVRTREIISKLKARMRNFGNINPNASVEFERIKKRFDFLNSQKEDLLGSKEKLEKLIMDMNTQIKDMFLQKYERINESFNYYFKVLFPLGNGELILATDGNEKDMGVDLKVDIGNNKFVPLSLLSGGEKTLVSMAFLFSIFATNLSPFYILDEADAALDDVNIDRFLSLLKKFAETQQIILITHQKKTMEIADTIYGVSMQSDGVSKIVSEKIERSDEKVN
ncbi:MAG: chromosome segregation SMC family protein [Actinomycetota bacterium]|nr:chromosome segregation SMC family protein [Actinomycetota bacterium]